MTTERNDDKVKVSRTLLKRSSIRIEKKGGKRVFVIPERLAETLMRNYNFTFEQLQVGGDIDLQELALHMDGQGQLEAEAGMVSEHARLLKELAVLYCESWYEKECQKIREYFYDKHGKYPTEAYVKGKLASGKKGKTWRLKQTEMKTLESNYRILNNVIRSAIVVKGDMLRSMRPLLQNDGNTVSGISVRVAKKVKTKLIV